VSNSIKHSSKGVIEIRLKKHEGYVEFAVKDEGEGIPKKELIEIFEMFKVGSKQETPAEGRGLGLALCKLAIEAHHGEIEARSDNEKGAEFIVTLPMI